MRAMGRPVHSDFGDGVGPGLRDQTQQSRQDHRHEQEPLLAAQGHRVTDHAEALPKVSLHFIGVNVAEVDTWLTIVLDLGMLSH